MLNFPPELWKHLPDALFLLGLSFLVGAVATFSLAAALAGLGVTCIVTAIGLAYFWSK